MPITAKRLCDGTGQQDEHTAGGSMNMYEMADGFRYCVTSYRTATFPDRAKCSDSPIVCFPSSMDMLSSRTYIDQPSS